MPSIQQIHSIKLRLLPSTTIPYTALSRSRQSSRSNRVGFTYSLQRPKKTASAVNPADRTDRVTSVTPTSKKDNGSRQHSRKNRSNQIRLTYILQRPNKTTTAINPAKRTNQ